MAAKSKAELRDISHAEFEKLAVLLDALDANVAMTKRDDDISIKDVVAHRAHWIDLFLGWYADGLAGKPVYFPAHGYKWNDLKRYNHDLRASQHDLGWLEAMALLRTNYRKLMDFIDDCSDAELYGGPMQGAHNRWPPGRWAEAAGPSHFRSASKYVRSCLRQDKLTQK